MNNRLPILIAASVPMAAASVCAHEVANGDCAVVFHVDADGVDASFDRNPKAYSMTKSIVASSDALSLKSAPGGGWAVSITPISKEKETGK